MADTVLPERVNGLRFTETFRVAVETWLLSFRGTHSPSPTRRPKTCLANLLHLLATWTISAL